MRVRVRWRLGPGRAIRRALVNGTWPPAQLRAKVWADVQLRSDAEGDPDVMNIIGARTIRWGDIEVEVTRGVACTEEGPSFWDYAFVLLRVEYIPTQHSND